MAAQKREVFSLLWIYQLLFNAREGRGDGGGITVLVQSRALSFRTRTPHVLPFPC